jgi:hypothetical protein
MQRRIPIGWLLGAFDTSEATNQAIKEPPVSKICALKINDICGALERRSKNPEDAFDRWLWIEADQI